MEKELKKIIQQAKNDFQRFDSEYKSLHEKLGFYQEHGFKEEERICLLKINATQMLVWSIKGLIEMLEKCIDHTQK